MEREKNQMFQILQPMIRLSPIIVLFSVFVFSVFTMSIGKFAAFFAAFLAATGIRFGIQQMFQKDNMPLALVRDECNAALLWPNDVHYSTYMLCTSLMYLLLPMILISSQNNISAVNYGTIFLFVGYLAVDWFVKLSVNCFSEDNSTKWVLLNILGGLTAGACISSLLYSYAQTLLFINEVHGGTEDVCSQPSNQQFRCSVYKDGTLVGQTIR
jgi:hypothetical protein